MNAPVYFISDVHLALANHEQEQQRRNRLFRLFDTVRESGGTLYILGDFFDFWFEYRHVIPRYYFDVLANLQALVTAGIRVEFILGNHDFWTRDFLTGVLGIRVHRQAVEVTIKGKRIWLTHGDGLLKGERGYRFMRRIIRSRPFVFLFRWLHPDLGVAFASRISATNRGNHDRREKWAEVRFAELLEVAENRWNAGLDTVIMGHYHLNRLYTTPEGKQLLCLGDWISHFTYGKIADDGLTLEVWPE